MEKKKFNQLEYTKEYNKTHYRRINLSVKLDEYDEIKKNLQRKQYKLY